MKRFRDNEVRRMVLFESDLINAISHEFRVYIKNHPVDPGMRGGPWRPGIAVVELVNPMRDDDLERMKAGVIYRAKLKEGGKDWYYLKGLDGSVKSWGPKVVKRWEDEDADN